MQREGYEYEKNLIKFLIRPCHFCMTFDFEEESYICYALWVPYEVYIKDFSKFHRFPPVLSSWWPSSHLLELNIQMCHTSKVALTCTLRSKIWLKVSKTCDISCFLQYCQFLATFETLSQRLKEGDKQSSYLQCTCQDTTFNVGQGKTMEFWKILYIHFIRDP